MLRCVYWQIATDVSEKHCDSTFRTKQSVEKKLCPNNPMKHIYEGWNFNSGNYLFTTETK